MSPLRLLDLVADVAPGVEASLVALAPALASRGMRIAALCTGPGPLIAVPSHLAATAGERVTAIASR